MHFHCPHFRAGVALTALIAVLAFTLARLPLLGHFGVLSLALLVGIAARALLHVPRSQHQGIGFSAKHLLRIGIVLLGVRLDFGLVAQAGPRIFLVAASVIVTGLVFMIWLGRRCGLPGMLPVILAVDSSICGASAVAAAAPVVRARNEDIALVVPLCSLIGTMGMLALSAAQSFLHLPPTTFGVLVGATLHEIAQVMAAASTLPSALEPGTVTKMMRVLLLAPAVIALGFCFRHASGNGAPRVNLGAILGSVWFVFAFLLVGTLNTALQQFLPAHAGAWAALDRNALLLSTFLMAMAMAGLGLQVDFARIRENGWRAATVAVTGWLVLVTLAAAEIYLLRLA